MVITVINSEVITFKGNHAYMRMEVVIDDTITKTYSSKRKHKGRTGYALELREDIRKQYRADAVIMAEESGANAGTDLAATKIFMNEAV